MNNIQSQLQVQSNEQELTGNAIEIITPPDTTAITTARRCELLNELFVHNSPGKYYQKDSGDYSFVNEVVTDQDLINHLDGKIVLGIPLQFTETGGSFVKTIIIDIDLNKSLWEDPNFNYSDYAGIIDEQVKLIQQQADLFSIPYYTEFSGFKGKHVIIFLENYLPIEKAYHFAHGIFGFEVVNNIDPEKIHWEIFPKNISPGSKSMVKLPYALHRRSNQRSVWVDNCFPEENISLVKKVFQQRLEDLLSPVWSPIINCKAVRSMYLKSVTAKHLTNEERVALATIYNKIENGKTFVVSEFISRCSDYNVEKTQYHLNRVNDLDYKAISCEKLQEQGLCSGPCKRIKDHKSPVYFYFRAMNNDKAITRLDDRVGTGRFKVTDDSFYIKEKIKEKEEWQKVSNFTMVIKESRSFIDLPIKEQVAEFRVEIGFQGKHFEADITSDHFYSDKDLPSEVMKYTKLPAIIYGRNKFLEAVSHFSDPQVSDGFTSPGWSPDKKMFVTPSVIITKDGIHPNNKYFIKETSSGEIGGFDFSILDNEDMQSLFRIIADYLLNATEPPIAMAMLGYAAYSIIEPYIYDHLRQNRFALFISGPSGRGKSHFATHFYHLFGNFRAVASWTSTVNSLNQMGYYLNGGMFLVDDFKDQNISLDDALRLFQNYADHNGRSRMTRTIELRITEPMRCGLLTTGEHSVTQESSSVARIVNLEITNLITEEQKLINAQIVRAYNLMPGFFPEFIQWILKADWKQLAAECEGWMKEFENRAGIRPNSTRVAANHGILLFSTRLVLWYLFRDETIVKEKVEQVRQYLESRMEATLDNVSSLQNHEKFIQFLRNMLARNEVAFSNNATALYLPETSAKAIGYITKNNAVYLDVENAYYLVVKTSKSFGPQYTYPINDLKRDLNLNGIIEKKSVVRKVDGKSKRLYKMLNNVFDDENAKPITELG